MIAAPAAAQYYPQQTYPQQYQQPYQQQYQQTISAAVPAAGYPGYGYNQGTPEPGTAIIDQLLGNRYNVTDRQAVLPVRERGDGPGAAQYGGYGYNNG